MPLPQTVQCAVEGRVARVTLNRPPLHILDLPTLEQYAAALDRVSRESGVVVCILSATGDKAFSTGVDIKDHTPDRVGAMLVGFHNVIRKVRSLECVTLALVRGMALGGGFELALSCDMIIAEEDATLGVPETWLGCFPPVAAAVLPRHLSPQKAYEIVLGGEPITAVEAGQMGLVNLIAPRGRVDEAVERFIAPFTEKSAATLRLAKRALRIGETAGEFGAALDATERLYGDDLMATRDAAEGIRAYLEKREPRWEDR
jgi:cyclohexa-1,5-dienecarbonyl-CoA hydratase